MVRDLLLILLLFPEIALFVIESVLQFHLGHLLSRRRTVLHLQNLTKLLTPLWVLFVHPADFEMDFLRDFQFQSGEKISCFVD